MSSARSYIGLGANLGATETTLLHAIEALQAIPGIERAESSRLYRSDPVDAPGPTYVNAVLALTTTLSPLGLLEALRDTEVQFGRERHFRNAPRTLDLDLLLYDRLSFTTPTLTVPHPRMHLRAFVLKPLIELVGLQLPVAGKSLGDWLKECQTQPCEPLGIAVGHSN